jgi:hypothetical protein
MANDERISDTVIDGVSAATDTDPLDLPPLYEVVDPDALDCLFHHDSREQGPSDRVEFVFAGCEVGIHADGRVVVDPSQSDTEPRTASSR